jgi:hypothetical protein
LRSPVTFHALLPAQETMIKPATWCDAGSRGLTQANLTLAIVTFGEPNATDLAASISHHPRASSKSVKRGSTFTFGDNCVDGRSR